jgi:hypothetical protein
MLQNPAALALATSLAARLAGVEGRAANAEQAAELAQPRRRCDCMVQQMTLMGECVECGGMDGEETLG